MQPFTTALLTSLGANSVILAFATGYIKLKFDKNLAAHKAQVEHIYNEKLATHSAPLDRANELAVAEFKHKLELAATERNFRFSHTFEETAKIIAGTYERLVALNQAVVDYTQQVDSAGATVKDELKKKYQQMANELYEYLLPKKIYVPKDTAGKILELARTIHSSAMQYSIAVNTGKALERTSDTTGRLFDQFFASMDAIPKLMDSLETEFQTILGFPLPQTTTGKTQL